MPCHRLALPGALALVLASFGHAPASAADPAPAKAPRQCFWASRVTGFTAVDDKAINVRVGVKDIYRLELVGACPDIDWAHEIALVSRGGSNICDGFDARVIVKGPTRPQSCLVRNVRRLTPEEAKALPPGEKP